MALFVAVSLLLLLHADEAALAGQKGPVASFAGCLGAAGNFKECLNDAAQKRNPSLATACKKEAAKCLRQDVLNMVVESAKNLAMTRCTMQGLASCADIWKVVTGRDMPGNREQQERAQQAEALKGLKDAVRETMSACLDSREACLERAKESFRNATGLGDSLLGQIRFDKERRSAAGAGAANTIEQCIANATEAQEKKRCITSEAARKAAALASGFNVSEITDADLLRAIKDRAKQSIGEDVKGCIMSATTLAEKRACADKMDKLKELFAATSGKDLDEIKDSDIKKLVRRNKQDDAFSVMYACGKTNNKTLLRECREGARRAIADFSGKDLGEISDFEVARETKGARIREMARLMDSCMRTADTSNEKTKCKGVAEALLKNLNTENFKGRLEHALEDAARAAVTEAKDLCEGGKCEEQVRAAIARAKGIRVEDITKLDERGILRKAAEAAAVEDARACKDARVANSTASCRSLYEKFLESSGKERPTSREEEATDRRKVTLEVVKTAIADSLKECYTGPRDAIRDCLAQAENYRSETLDFVMEDGGIKDSRKRKAKQKQAERKAAIETLGDIFRTCMLQANATREDCKAQLLDIKKSTDLSDGSDDILDGYFSFSLLTEPAGSCNETEMKECRTAAKERCLQSGMKRRRLIVMQKLAQIRAAAEEWGHCVEGLSVSNSSDMSECEVLALKKFRFVRGVLGKKFNMTLEHIKDVGMAYVDAIELKLHRKKEVELHAKTNETDCNDKVLEQFKHQTRNEVYAVIPVAEVLDMSCELVDDAPEYSVVVKANLTDNEVQDLAEKVSDAIAAKSFDMRRLLALDGHEGTWLRRLVSAGVSESFGAQSINLQGAGGTPSLMATGGTTGAMAVSGTTGAIALGRTTAAVANIASTVQSSPTSGNNQQNNPTIGQVNAAVGSQAATALLAVLLGALKW